MIRSLLFGSALTILMTSTSAVTGLAAQPAPIVLAQATDGGYRVNELEQEVRRLTGKVEELTFQLLELQERMRKMQEDNELRFQELEEKHSDAVDAAPETNSETKPADVATNESKNGGESLGKSEPSGAATPDVNSVNRETTATVEPARPQPVQRSLKPRALGTLTFDKDGNVVGDNNSGNQSGEKIAKLPLPGVFSNGVDGGIEAAEYGPTPSAVFDVGKSALKNKRYKRAEGAFQAYMKAWPKDPREGEARYYLAEALFWQKQYYKAANIYLDTHNAHPQAPTAADNLLGLGLALAGLNQREVACATYSEVLKQYPQSQSRLGPRVEAEQTSAKC